MSLRNSTSVAALVFGILPALATASEPAPRLYATWNPEDASERLEISADRLTISNGSRDWGSARATLSVDTGVWYWETTYSHTTIGLSDVQSGLAYSDWNLEAPPGALGNGARAVGTNRAGDILVGGQVLANVASVSNNAVVRHLLDADTGEYQIANAAGPWVSATPLPGFFSQTPQFPIASAVGQIPSPISGIGYVTANFGASPFVYEVPAGAHPGIFVDDLILRDGFELPQ